MKFENNDRTILRECARKLVELSRTQMMSERRDLWRQHNRMESVRPVVYIDPQGAWPELVLDKSLLCGEPAARDIERLLRRKIYVAEHFASDNVAEAEWIVRKVVHSSGWGLEAKRSHSSDERGAFGFDPVIKDYSDLKKLRCPEITYDEKETNDRLQFCQDLFGDILQVHLKGIDHLSYHLMNQFSALRGLQETLMDMIDNPLMIHDAMMFLEEGHHRILKQFTAQNLLGLNNDNTPIYTSGHGYTNELPGPGHDPANIRPADLWGWAEAQEMAVVSPEMHAEFVFPYEKRLLEPFGLNGYGCCDDVTDKLNFVLTIPRLRRVSVSPWANVDKCAERIRDKAIFMWKPHPAHLVGNFNPSKIRDYLKHTVKVARSCNCSLEIVLLDTHTCENHPERFEAWAQIAHQAVTNVQ
ncbi:MAG: hypothetical protein HQL31_02400 [Planctomycetes bacterium]|nr:hypothetical protein [Planctomycetota bacterium]